MIGRVLIRAGIVVSEIIAPTGRPTGPVVQERIASRIQVQIELRVRNSEKKSPKNHEILPVCLPDTSL